MQYTCTQIPQTCSLPEREQPHRPAAALPRTLIHKQNPAIHPCYRLFVSACASARLRQGGKAAPHATRSPAEELTLVSYRRAAGHGRRHPVSKMPT